MWPSHESDNGQSGAAALRDFNPAYVGLGSLASKATEAVRPYTSATPPKADVNSTPWLRRFVPIPVVSRCSKIPYSITSSARASSIGGTSKPSAFAVSRLITSSSFVGNSIGKSPAFDPFNILST